MQDRDKILVIAGYDPSGGAGILMDSKVIYKLGGYPLCVPTCLTVQDTKQVYEVFKLPSEYLKESLNKIYEDVKNIKAVKIGVLYSKENIRILIDFLKEKKLKNIVLDPIVFPTKGVSLIEENFLEELFKLIELCDLITPNIKEVEYLVGEKIRRIEDMQSIALKIKKNFGVKYVIIKGGHLESDFIYDLLFDGDKYYYFRRKRIKGLNLHGTGCIFSSALSFYLAQKRDIYKAFKLSEKFMNKVLKNTLKVGEGMNIGNI